MTELPEPIEAAKMNRKFEIVLKLWQARSWRGRRSLHFGVCGCGFFGHGSLYKQDSTSELSHDVRDGLNVGSPVGQRAAACHEH